MKSRNALLLLVFLIIGLLPSYVSASTPENHHAPRLYRGTMIHGRAEPFPDYPPQPFAGAYMDTNGLHRSFGDVKKARVTVSFPDTDPLVIQADNWLAGGMFVTGYDNERDQIDYGYYTMLTLEHDGTLYLDFGINETYECLWPLMPQGPLPRTKSLFKNTTTIEGVSPSTPITLTTSWDEPDTGHIRWKYTVDGVTTVAGEVNATGLPNCSDIQTCFYVGSRDLGGIPWVTWIPYWQSYLFQFGITSRYNIGQGGWNVLLSNPSYFKDGEWHNVETAKSIGGQNALLDYRYMWGGEDYEGVNAYYYPALEPRNVKFCYSGESIPDHTLFWGIPVAPANRSETYTYSPLPEPDYAHAEVNENNAEYRLEVGTPVHHEPDSDSYARASLFKDFVPKHTITDPTFYFRFHASGWMDARIEGTGSYTYLNAFLGLWHNENVLFRSDQTVQDVSEEEKEIGFRDEIFGTYVGELLEGETYTIEYGFSVFEHEAHADFAGEYRIKASWIIKADNYKLTVRTYDLEENEKFNVTVRIGPDYYKSPVENQVVACGEHSLQVASVFYRGDYKYTFQHWENDDTSNPRTVSILEDRIVRAYYDKIYVGDDGDGGDGGWGFGCPMLSVYDGTGYVEEGYLDIHNPDGVDVVTSHVLVNTPEAVEHRYVMRLTEHPQTHSHIDQVQLCATVKNGTEIKLPLVSAVHSEDGDVLQQLLLSDDVRTDTVGADLNNGTSEGIDLKFVVPDGLELEGVTFIIEGYNPLFKP